tara:strand:+ start:206 stop:2545 length:2340 start_codon:yes stop_codon:yes gene_type:complete
MVVTPSKGLLDFYNNQVRNQGSVWNKYLGIRTKTYTKSWEELLPYERTNLKESYESFKRHLPTYRKIAQQNLISVDEAGKLLGIPEVRAAPTAKYSRGRMTSGFPVIISDSMTRGTKGSERVGTGQAMIKKILKPKFKLQQLNIGLGEGNLRWFIKDPRKIEGGTKILQDYYLRKGRKFGIMPEVVERVKSLHRNPTIINLLKEGNFADGKALNAIQEKWGWTPSQASTATLRLAQTYNGKDFINVDFKLPKNKSVARAIFEGIEKAPFGNIFHARGYQIAMDTITENLGEKYFQRGSMDSFKREIRTILAKEKIPLYDNKLPEAKRYGFNLNELVGVSPSARAGSHPYSQFVNLMEGKFNIGHYSQYVKRLGDYQLQLQDAIKKGNPGSVIKKFDTYNKDFRNIHDLKKGDLPTLSLKDPSKLYAAKRLEELEGLGIDLREYFKKSKYSIDVGDAPTIKEIKQSPASLKKLRVLDPLGRIDNLGIFKNQLLKAAKTNEGGVCNLFRAEGGRIGFAAGSNCARQMEMAFDTDPVRTTEQINKIKTVPEKLKTAGMGFLNIARKGGKYGAIAAAGAVSAGLVKQFMNDDPTTYLSDENQQKNLLIDMMTSPIDETPQERPAILDWQLPVLGAETVAGTAVVAPSTIEAARSARFGKKPSGITKTALKTLGRGLMTTGTPLGLAALEPLHIAGQIQEGDSPTDIATNPWNWLGPTFASSMTRAATKGLGENIGKIMRLGISPTALRGLSRMGGYGFAASLGITGLQKFGDWRNKRGWFSEE